MKTSARNWSAAALGLACFLAAAPAARAHSLNVTIEGLKLGETAPFEEVEFIDGKKFDLKEQRGKDLVVFFFWSYYFKDYKASLDLAGKLVQEFSGKNAVFLSVNLDSDDNKAGALLSGAGIDVRSTCNPFLTFPSRLLGTVASDTASVVVLDENRKVSFLWGLANSEDFRQARTSLTEQSERLKKAHLSDKKGD